MFHKYFLSLKHRQPEHIQRDAEVSFENDKSNNAADSVKKLTQF
jgi:hypothetical protein